MAYGYDTVGEMIAAYEGTLWSGTLLYSYGYDDLGRRQGYKRGNGAFTGYDYGLDLKLSAMNHYFPSGTINQYASYQWDPAGRMHKLSTANSSYDWQPPYGFSRGYASDGQNRYTVSGALSLGYGLGDRGHRRQRQPQPDQHL